MWNLIPKIFDRFIEEESTESSEGHESHLGGTSRSTNRPKEEHSKPWNT